MPRGTSEKKSWDEMDLNYLGFIILNLTYFLFRVPGVACLNLADQVRFIANISVTLASIYKSVEPISENEDTRT